VSSIAFWKGSSLRTRPSEHEAIHLLATAGCSPAVIRHCKAVADLATRIAQQIARHGISIDVDLVRIGALLHDLGRARTHAIDHAVVGAAIAQGLRLPVPLVRIIERHVGSGLTAAEAARLGLPKRSFLPRSLEEKVVVYADKLIAGSHELGFDEALTAFSMELGSVLGAPAINRLKQLHRELTALTGVPS
jgi:uncharacterized protein